MPLIARQRSRLAVLAVLALVGSLLAVSAVPAVAAADDTADNKADYSACVGAATEDAGFTDMGSSTHADAANCLAHYGISMGTGDGDTFSPDRAVTRLQMARFLARATGPAGIDTMMAADQMLTDTDDKDANTVAALGIMKARSDGSFDPSGLVSRAEMAVHLAAFLSKAIQGPGGDLEGLQSKDGLDSGKTAFTDISEVTVSQNKAIKDIFELGITSGTTATTFAPSSPVSRGQMASFITRALAHTNARPAGISVQAKANGDTGVAHDITVSVRDADHQPEPDALVDVISTTKPDEAFNDEGACVTKNLSGDSKDCTITTGDHATDPDGNTDGASVDLPDAAGTLTVMAWTGEVGDKFDRDSTDFASIEIDAALPRDSVKVTNDMKKNSKNLKFGDTVTYTLQVVNSEGDPVTDEGLPVTVTAVITDTTDGTGRGADAADVDLNTVLTGNQLRSTSSTNSSVHKTDAAGRIQVSYSQDDPDGDAKADEVTLTLTFAQGTGTPSINTGGAIDHDGGDTGAAGLQAIWADADPVASTLTLSQRVMYHETNDDGVSNTLMATLVDQYGDPVRSVKVKVWSTVSNPVDGDSLGLGGSADGTAGSAADPADRRTTSRKGVATKTYTRAETDAATETLGAQYATFAGDCEDATTACTETDDGATPFTVTADTVSHYWAARAEGTVNSNSVLVADKDNNTIVLGPTTGPQLLTYKAGDQFTITANASGVEGPTGAVTMEAFEKALSTLADSTADTEAADTVSAVIGDDEDDINSFTIDLNS